MQQSNKELEMRANATEITNFFWHCLVAARLSDEFLDNTVTRLHVLNAVRKATVCIAGGKGVQYASDGAKTQRDSLGKPWEQCGLIKEHTIPVSIVRALVRDELKTTKASAGAAAPLVMSEQETQGLTPEVINLFQQHPRAWAAARIIRDWTLLAWITGEEDREFDNKVRHGGISIRKRMPKGWNSDQDRFARYPPCDIKVSLI